MTGGEAMMMFMEDGKMLGRDFLPKLIGDPSYGYPSRFFKRIAGFYVRVI